MKKEQDLAAITSQVFLGVSIECARCHNHPLEKWTRDDFNGMAAFFSQVKYKNAPARATTSASSTSISSASSRIPTPSRSTGPRLWTDRCLPSPTKVDRRELLADWITSPTNPFFAKALVNRMWRNFMGRGLVEPVDDFRITNPPTNEPLLDALAKDFVDHGYDLHQLIRRITASRAYQLSVETERSQSRRQDGLLAPLQPPPHRRADARFHLASHRRRPSSFTSLYPGHARRAIARARDRVVLSRSVRPPQPPAHLRAQAAAHAQPGAAPDQRRHHSEKGDRSAAACWTKCWRNIARRARWSKKCICARSRAIRTRKKARTPRPRSPKQPSAKRGLEDVFWALLNSKEFLYNH